MGKKGKKGGDDDDYFASLAESSAEKMKGAAPPEDDEDAVLAREEKKRAAALEKKEKQAAEARDLADVAARARAAMDKRAKAKKPKKDDEEVFEEEDVPETTPFLAAPAPAEAAQSDAGPAAAVPLSPFLKVLLALRPWSAECGREGLVAAMLRWLWALCAALATADQLALVDGALRLTDSGAAERLDAEAARRKADELWSGNAWFPRDFGIDALGTVQLSDCGEHLERWEKNLRTKGAAAGKWVRCRDGEGWATAPTRLLAQDEDIPAGEIRFLACHGGRAFECTAFVEAGLISASDARDLEVVDSGKALLSFQEDSQGRLTATLLQKYAAALAQGHVGAAVQKKEKISRADKKQKKMGYNR
ncbi:hypothetical protein M885DRAFT_620589 [Pelagophyceae sp. CCMP2097]|nr:hypothetical protein M885DRAFT_620589 [Pelagophyceae sp. CCMP2097]